MSDHSFTMQTNYIVCRSCNVRALKNSASGLAGIRLGSQKQRGRDIPPMLYGEKEGKSTAASARPTALQTEVNDGDPAAPSKRGAEATLSSRGCRHSLRPTRPTDRRAGAKDTRKKKSCSTLQLQAYGIVPALT